MNIHKLKDKRKNILRQLASNYKKRFELNNIISELEEAKTNNKIAIDELHRMNKRVFKK